MRPISWPKIHVLVFDADGTLWDFESVMKHALSLVLIEMHRHLPVPGWMDVDALIDIRNRTAEAMQGERFDAIRLEAFRRTLHAAGCRDEALAMQLNALYLRHRFGDIRLYPDVRPALGMLGQRFVLGLMTNGNSYPDRCGLPGIFRFEVYSEMHGVEKPDRRLFDIMVERAGFSREHILYIGDSLEHDVAGAQAAGVGAVWVNRDGKKAGAGSQPDLEVASLTELADKIP